MPEAFRERLVRSLVRVPFAHRAASHLYAPFSARATLPDYREPGCVPQREVQVDPQSPLFISARFRSGSTLLWQCFQRLEGFTAYYEPFNDRKWFDPKCRGNKVDTSHRGVDDYASNYDNLEHLSQSFRDHWGVRHLSLGAQANQPQMLGYIQGLIKGAADRSVLQFNRIDFRLPFLRAAFPEAVFLHLSRNPRDTWSSTLRGVANDCDWTINSFGPYSKFYLLNWYHDLSMSYPQMWRNPSTTHPYEIHYLIHRLSELFAYRDCDVFLHYENLEANLVAEIKRLLTSIGADTVDLSPIENLLSPRNQAYDHSGSLSLYSEIEARVDTWLCEWLGSTSL